MWGWGNGTSSKADDKTAGAQSRLSAFWSQATAVATSYANTLRPTLSGAGITIRALASNPNFPQHFPQYCFPLPYLPSNSAYVPFQINVSKLEYITDRQVVQFIIEDNRNDPSKDLVLKEQCIPPHLQAYYYYLFIANRLKNTEQQFDFIKAVLANLSYDEKEEKEGQVVIPLCFTVTLCNVEYPPVSELISTDGSTAQDSGTKKPQYVSRATSIATSVSKVGLGYKSYETASKPASPIPDDIIVISVNALVRDLVRQFPELLTKKEFDTYKTLMDYARYFRRIRTVKVLEEAKQEVLVRQEQQWKAAIAEIRVYIETINDDRFKEKATRIIGLIERDSKSTTYLDIKPLEWQCNYIKLVFSCITTLRKAAQTGLSLNGHDAAFQHVIEKILNELDLENISEHTKQIEYLRNSLIDADTAIRAAMTTMGKQNFSIDEINSFLLRYQNKIIAIYDIFTTEKELTADKLAEAKECSLVIEFCEVVALILNMECNAESDVAERRAAITTLQREVRELLLQDTVLNNLKGHIETLTKRHQLFIAQDRLIKEAIAEGSKTETHVVIAAFRDRFKHVLLSYYSQAHIREFDANEKQILTSVGLLNEFCECATTVFNIKVDSPEILERRTSVAALQAWVSELLRKDFVLDEFIEYTQTLYTRHQLFAAQDTLIQEALAKVNKTETHEAVAAFRDNFRHVLLGFYSEAYIREFNPTENRVIDNASLLVHFCAQATAVFDIAVDSSDIPFRQTAIVALHGEAKKLLTNETIQSVNFFRLVPQLARMPVVFVKMDDLIKQALNVFGRVRTDHDAVNQAITRYKTIIAAHRYQQFTEYLRQAEDSEMVAGLQAVIARAEKLVIFCEVAIKVYEIKPAAIADDRRANTVRLLQQEVAQSLKSEAYEDIRDFDCEVLARKIAINHDTFTANDRRIQAALVSLSEIKIPSESPVKQIIKLYTDRLSQFYLAAATEDLSRNELFNGFANVARFEKSCLLVQRFYEIPDPNLKDEKSRAKSAIDVLQQHASQVLERAISPDLDEEPILTRLETLAKEVETIYEAFIKCNRIVTEAIRELDGSVRVSSPTVRTFIGQYREFLLGFYTDFATNKALDFTKLQRVCNVTLVAGLFTTLSTICELKTSDTDPASNKVIALLKTQADTIIASGVSFDFTNSGPVTRELQIKLDTFNGIHAHIKKLQLSAEFSKQLTLLVDKSQTGQINQSRLQAIKSVRDSLAEKLCVSITSSSLDARKFDAEIQKAMTAFQAFDKDLLAYLKYTKDNDDPSLLSKIVERVKEAYEGYARGDAPLAIMKQLEGAAVVIRKQYFLAYINDSIAPLRAQELDTTLTPVVKKINQSRLQAIESLQKRLASKLDPKVPNDKQEAAAFKRDLEEAIAAFQVLDKILINILTHTKTHDGDWEPDEIGEPVQSMADKMGEPVQSAYENYAKDFDLDNVMRIFSLTATALRRSHYSITIFGKKADKIAEEFRNLKKGPAFFAKINPKPPRCEVQQELLNKLSEMQPVDLKSGIVNEKYSTQVTTVIRAAIDQRNADHNAVAKAAGAIIPKITESELAKLLTVFFDHYKTKGNLKNYKAPTAAPAAAKSPNGKP